MLWSTPLHDSWAADLVPHLHSVFKTFLPLAVPPRVRKPVPWLRYQITRCSREFPWDRPRIVCFVIRVSTCPSSSILLPVPPASWKLTEPTGSLSKGRVHPACDTRKGAVRRGTVVQPAKPSRKPGSTASVSPTHLACSQSSQHELSFIGIPIRAMASLPLPPFHCIASVCGKIGRIQAGRRKEELEEYGNGYSNWSTGVGVAIALHDTHERRRDSCRVWRRPGSEASRECSEAAQCRRIGLFGNMQRMGRTSFNYRAALERLAGDVVSIACLLVLISTKGGRTGSFL